MCSLSNGVKKTGLGPTYAENFDDGDIDDGDPTDWYTTGSYWDASSGELKWTSTAGISGQCSNPDLTYSDFQAEFDLMADGYYQDNYWAAFAFRKNSYSDWYSTSGYMVYYRYNGWIELYSASGGVLKTSNTGKDLSTWRHVKIVANGSSIKVYVDGELEIDHSDGTYTSGYFGLNVFGVAARYDNLAILSNTEVHYVRDVDGSVLAEYDVAGNLLAEYIYANGQRIARVDSSGAVHVYLNDHLGSARAMIGNGWSANYYPYGEIASQSGSSAETRYDFTGHERDQGTGLVYAGARLLEPEIGRWLSVDPLVGKYPAWSPYNYALGNPVNAFDRDGRDVYDSRDPKKTALTATQLQQITLNTIRQFLTDPKGKYELFLRTNTRATQNDVYQKDGQFVVEFGGTLRRHWFRGYEGIARYTLHTGFSLDPEDRATGYFSTASEISFEKNPALSKDAGKDILQLKFGATIWNPGGQSYAQAHGDFFIIITGTPEEINAELNKVGWRVIQDDSGNYQIEEIEKENEN